MSECKYIVDKLNQGLVECVDFHKFCKNMLIGADCNSTYDVEKYSNWLREAVQCTCFVKQIMKSGTQQEVLFNGKVKSNGPSQD